MEKLLQEKYTILDKFLDEEHVLVHLITAYEGVLIPENFKKSPVLTLKYSRFFRGAMELSKEKITGDLLFGATYFTCEVPLNAIWGVTSASGKNILWPESAPREILEKITNFAVSDDLTEEKSKPSAPALVSDNTKSKKPRSVSKKNEKPSFLKRVK